MRDLDIGEVGRRAGVPPSTLRYYEEKGLIRSVGRRGLRHAAACPAPTHMECPRFRRLVGLAMPARKSARRAIANPAVQVQIRRRG